MSSGSYRQVDVTCPFYKYDDGKSIIVCEGITDQSTITLRFFKKSDFLIQYETYCCHCNRFCELYQMLMKKYEE